jgi:hypothetical protein
MENRSVRGMYWVTINGAGPPSTAVVVGLYEFEDLKQAEETRASVAQNGIGSVVERDGGRVLFVGVNGRVSDSKALFDRLVK